MQLSEITPAPLGREGQRRVVAVGEYELGIFNAAIPARVPQKHLEIPVETRRPRFVDLRILYFEKMSTTGSEHIHR